jgi:WXG100 family type VII secretion target
MSGNISKTDRVLLDSARDLQTTHEEVRSDLARMRSQLENLQAQWVGRGGQSFQHVITSWQGKADQVLRCMDEFKEQLTASESTYRDTEDHVAAQFMKYADGLG